MRSIYSILLSGVFLLLMIPSFGQKYQDLPESYQDEVSKREWRKAQRLADQQEGDFGLSPIDLIYYDDQPAVQGFSFSGLSITSWGREYLLPSSVRERVLNECGQYPFIVGTVDSGTDETHSEFSGDHWLPASNYTGQSAKHWHGTHVSGIMWQMIGEVILKHDNGRMKDIQILNGQGSGSFSGAINMVASETAYFKPFIEREVGVFLNNSWGYDGPPIAAMERELKISSEAGICWIGSAGNAGKVIDGYPGMSEYFNSIASIDPSGRRSSFSTMNDQVDNAAPGSGINSTLPGNRQGKASGTSMSSPFVTGLAALAYGKYGPVLMGANMNKYLNAICTDISPEGLDNQTGYGVPFVIKMLDTDPCSLGLFDCKDQPDNPGDGPGDPPVDEPETPEEPVTSSSVAYSSDRGHVMRYRLESQSDWSIIYVSDIKVSAEGSGSPEELFDQVSQFVNGYFNNRGIVLTDEMGYTDAVWWTGQFLEYIARNEGLAIQVSSVQGQDEYGRSTIQVGFDRATANATDVRIEDVDTSVPDEYFDTPQEKLPRWLVKAEWTVSNTIGGRGVPKYTFDDSVGLYYTYVTALEVTEELLDKSPPFDGASVKKIIAVYRR